MKSTLEPQVAQALLRAELGDVFSILGMHTTAEGLVVRVFLPDGAAVRILERGGEGLAYEADKTHSEGIFEASIVERRELFSYENRDRRPSRRKKPLSRPLFLLAAIGLQGPISLQ
jgi:1,4-alpha-glucan branching enzyme